MPSTVSISAISPYDEAATVLIDELVSELTSRYADRDDDEATSFHPEDVMVPRSAFLLATINGAPVGCGALRPINDEVAELKRMYVRKEARGEGVGRALLAELERLAIGFGYHRLVLETGVRQPEAIALYEGRGFARIANYADYADNPLSVCFGKEIKA